MKNFEMITTLFPTTTQVEWNRKAYPGTSFLTQNQMKDVVAEWIDEALKAKAVEWPVQRKSFKYAFPEGERNGVRKIEILVDKTGVYSIYPLEGSQVYKWFKDQWNNVPFQELNR
jgi:hypothetical protein